MKYVSRQTLTHFGKTAIATLAVALPVALSGGLGATSPAAAQSMADCAALAELRGIGRADAAAAGHGQQGRDTARAAQILPTIVSATWMPAAAPVPEHCRVEGFVTTGDKHDGFNQVNFRLNLPSDWNGKLYFGGNGGFAGAIQADLITPMGRGYAAVGTDTGHQASGIDASWAQDSPTKVIDFGYRAVHVTAVAAKTITASYYDGDIAYAYFDGCSRGGGQALMAAQRFPHDFDGIIGGAPAYNWPRLLLGFAWGQRLIYPDRTDLSTPILPLAKLPYIEAEVNANCDAIDGIADGIVDDPRMCSFDAGVDLAACAPGNEADPNCLTAPELTALQAVYAGPSNAQGQIWPGFPVSGEAGPNNWNIWIVGFENLFGPGNPNLHHAFGGDFFKYLAFADNDDGSFDFRDLDYETVLPSLEPIGQILNATDPDLAAFGERGGKLLLWQGWSDAAITAFGTIDYYQAVVATLGLAQAEEVVRLYMMPGVYHCGGGPGPNVFDRLTALESWVEDGVRPEALIATHSTGGVVDIERPLCPYPEVARLIDPGGSTVTASNFQCVTP